MKISEIPRSAALAWCPLSEHSNVIATGTLAGSLKDFSSGTKLEFFSFNLNSLEPNLLGGIDAYDRFYKLVWGNPSAETYPSGVVAGAMVDGTIGLWDPAPIMNKT